MATIWGVTSGDYDDHCVDAVFTTKLKAQEYLDVLLLLDHTAMLEEFGLDPDPVEIVALTTVTVFKDGAARYCETRRAYSNQDGFRGYDLDGRYMWWAVTTADKEHAIRVAKEKHAMLIAAGVWCEDEATRALLEVT